MGATRGREGKEGASGARRFFGGVARDVASEGELLGNQHGRVGCSPVTTPYAYVAGNLKYHSHAPLGDFGLYSALHSTTFYYQFSTPASSSLLSVTSPSN